MSAINGSQRTKKPRRLSLLSRNARTQFVVSLVLISVIPVLAFLYLILSDETGGPSRWVVVGSLGVLVFLGYVLMIKYPATIVRLRAYLERVARTEIPDKARRVEADDDIAAIGKYLDLIIFDTASRLVTIQNQQKALIAAEQQRVMIQSLGAACHHLGQPATVLVAYLDILRKREQTPESRAMIEQCLKASHSLEDILARLNRVSEYRTEPYLIPPDGSEASPDDRILSV